jgi:hypothetical protein
MIVKNIKRDPQIRVTGRVKPSTNGETEMIVFSFSLLYFQITCIVSMPYEGRDVCPVYVKFGVNSHIRPDTLNHDRTEETV